VVIAGVEASSCDHIGRTEHVLSLIQSDDDRRADFNAGFGLQQASSTDLHGQFKTKPIEAGKSRNATWKPRSLGILQCDSYLPISLISGNLVLELTFLDDPAAGLNTTSPNSSSYNASELTCHVDVLSLDPTFLTSLSQHLFARNSLQLMYENTSTSQYSILSASSQIAHARSASRLNQVLLTFGKADVADSAEKSQVELLYPAGNSLKARLTIGEKRMPATEDLHGAAMFYRNLISAIGSRAPAISRAEFESKSFIASFDLEAAPKIQHSGISTLNAPLNVFLESLFTSADATPPTQMYLQTTSDVLMEVSKRGVLISV
jgi:hypothetical protein